MVSIAILAPDILAELNLGIQTAAQCHGINIYQKLIHDPDSELG